MSRDPANPYSSPMKSSAMPTGSGQLASLLDRFLGALIDGLIAMAIVIPVGLVLGLIIGLTGILDLDSIFGRLVLNLFSAVAGIAIFLALNGYLLATKGQTIGKMVVKTQIVSESTGQIMPFATLIAKRYVPVWLVTSIPYVGGLAGLVNVLLIFRENRHCLHDDLAGTKVISLK